ncbi:hypothetical protein G3A_23435 [Bacillus sp. 17376]|nr:hypothetical protein G3A_23435 [Bacillus sp. 17376]
MPFPHAPIGLFIVHFDLVGFRQVVCPDHLKKCKQPNIRKDLIIVRLIKKFIYYKKLANDTFYNK